ncbi:MAG: 50S ribosomal protein L9 [Thermoanaerobaculaceae bacterium]|jgi:large subunit ribosomal protein L9|nr:50S ribosomal protein L9 [Thermoanaerobaculaceae bacterium]
MKVILNDQVENLGDRGAICDVKPGYARNFLIPKGIAYEATPANLARFKQEQRRWLEAMQKQKAQAELLAGKIAGLELTFVRRAGDGDALYGSVTSTDVATALEAKGFEVDRRKIEIGQHIKRLGSFSAELHLHRDVRVPITLHVVREGEQASA